MAAWVEREHERITPQYLPRGNDLSGYTQRQLDAVRCPFARSSVRHVRHSEGQDSKSQIQVQKNNPFDGLWNSDMPALWAAILSLLTITLAE